MLRGPHWRRSISTPLASEGADPAGVRRNVERRRTRLEDFARCLSVSEAGVVAAAHGRQSERGEIHPSASWLAMERPPGSSVAASVEPLAWVEVEAEAEVASVVEELSLARQTLD